MHARQDRESGSIVGKKQLLSHGYQSLWVDNCLYFGNSPETHVRFGSSACAFIRASQTIFFPLSSWGVAPSSWGRTRTKGVGNNLLGGLSGESRCRSSMFDKIDLFNSFWFCFPVYLSMISQEQTGKFSVDRFPPRSHWPYQSTKNWCRKWLGSPAAGWISIGRYNRNPWKRGLSGVNDKAAFQYRGWTIWISFLYFFSRFSRSSHLFSSNSPVLPGTLPVLC